MIGKKHNFNICKIISNHPGSPVSTSVNGVSKNHELFSFSYGQVNGEIGEYDISQSDHMELEIYD